MNKIIKYILLSYSLIMSSCKVMYRPNMVNVPLLKESGDMQVNINSRNIQLSYAITDNIGLMVNGYSQKNKWSVESGGNKSEYISKRMFGEVGAGYFKQFDENNNFSIYGGAGYGFLDYTTDYTGSNKNSQSKWEAKSSRFFIQPAYTYGTKNIDFGVFSRCVGVNFSKIQTNYLTTDLENEKLNKVSGKLWAFVEPGVVFRAGTDAVKLQVQTFYSIKLNSEELSYKAFNFNLGLTVSPSVFWKKK